MERYEAESEHSEPEPEEITGNFVAFTVVVASESDTEGRDYQSAEDKDYLLLLLNKSMTSIVPNGK